MKPTASREHTSPRKDGISGGCRLERPSTSKVTFVAARLVTIASTPRGAVFCRLKMSIRAADACLSVSGTGVSKGVSLPKIGPVVKLSHWLQDTVSSRSGV